MLISNDFLFATDGSVDQGETDNQLICYDMPEIDLGISGLFPEPLLVWLGLEVLRLSR